MITVRLPAFLTIGPIFGAIAQRQAGVQYRIPSPDEPYHTLRAEGERLIVQRECFDAIKFPIFWDRLGDGLVIEGGHIAQYESNQIVIIAGEGENAQYVKPEPRHAVGPDYLEQMHKGGLSRSYRDRR